ncbi:CAPA peptides [Cephus cinctus]|uniref:CAPA peptides n=1 Tax=Cephus cinctus TaxID=211228 RepID=A0AAJ7FRZ0_CEPCN|nr:CAPA peptides [Cephus cinctus]
MRNHLSLVLVLLVVTTSLNRGEKIKNERRAAGLVPYPRVGRAPAMTNCPSIKRAVGVFRRPLQGRSGAPPNVIRELEPDVDADPVGEVDPDVELDIMMDTEYQGEKPRVLFFSPILSKLANSALRNLS